MSKQAIKIELNEKEDAIIYYEKTLSKNIIIRKRATVIYYASRNISSIIDLHKCCGYTRVFILAAIANYPVMLTSNPSVCVILLTIRQCSFVVFLGIRIFCSAFFGHFAIAASIT